MLTRYLQVLGALLATLLLTSCAQLWWVESSGQPQLIKLGFGDSADSQRPVRYPGVWAIAPTKGPKRLIIWPESNHVEVLLSLAQLWEKDYFLLYVLLKPRLPNHQPGRYESPGPLTYEEIATFSRRFRGFLETDGRHHFWIRSTTHAGALVYDKHNWIYAYGDLDAYIDLLRRLGFREGRAELPSPHIHNYHPANDAEEKSVMGYWQWLRYPLQPPDEE